MLKIEIASEIKRSIDLDTPNGKSLIEHVNLEKLLSEKKADFNLNNYFNSSREEIKEVEVRK